MAGGTRHAIRVAPWVSMSGCFLSAPLSGTSCTGTANPKLTCWAYGLQRSRPAFLESGDRPGIWDKTGEGAVNSGRRRSAGGYIHLEVRPVSETGPAVCSDHFAVNLVRAADTGGSEAQSHPRGRLRLPGDRQPHDDESLRRYPVKVRPTG